MKRAILFIFITSFAFPGITQENSREYRTILDGKELHISGMGGPLMLFTPVAGEFGQMMGGGGGILLNNFFFGGYGIGLTTQVPDYANTMYNDDILSLGHGGFWIGYSILGHLPVHLAVSTLIGFGELGLIVPGDYQNWLYDQIFVLTPILELEFNITRYFRIGAGATYSLFTGVNNIQGYSSGDFSAPGAFLGFKFGWF